MRSVLVGVIMVGVVIGLRVPRGPATAEAAEPAPVAAPTAPATDLRLPAGFAVSRASAPVELPIPDEAPVETVLEREGSGHFLTTASVNGAAVRFVVDTGADMVALTQDDARRAGVRFDPAAFEVIGKGASGEVRGEEVEIDTLSLDGKRATGVTGVVLETSDVSLLGQSYLRHLASVEIRGDQMRLR